MNTATATDNSLLDACPAEWQMLRHYPHNVLVEGPVAATNALVRLLHPHFREPSNSTQPHRPLELPGRETGSLVLRDVSAVDADDQRRLFEWLNDTGAATQIISTSPCPLIALVDAGLFDAALYYRLNVLLLQVGSRTAMTSDDVEGEP